MTASIRCFSTSVQSADPHLGGGWSLNSRPVRSNPSRPVSPARRAADRMAAPRGQLLEQLIQLVRVVAVIRISMREASSLVRPMSNFRIFMRPHSMILSKIADR